MERRERTEKESKIRGRRGLFLLLLALVFRPPPRPHFSLLLFAIFVPSLRAVLIALSTFSVSLPRHEERCWMDGSKRVTRLSMRPDTRARSSRRLENVERERRKGDPLEAGHKLEWDRIRYRRMKLRA